MVEDLVFLGSGRSSKCLKVSISSAYCDGMSEYLPPCKILGLVDVTGLAQQEPDET